MIFSKKTVASITAPLSKMIQELRDHAATQVNEAEGHEKKIDGLRVAAHGCRNEATQAVAQADLFAKNLILQ